MNKRARENRPNPPPPTAEARQLFKDLTRVFAERRCSNALIIRHSLMEDDALKKLGRRCKPVLRIEMTDPVAWLKQPHPKRRYPTGIVWDASAVLSDSDYKRLLARLRDLDCETVYVRHLTRHGNFRSRSRYLRSLGFTPLKKYDDGTSLFYFDIYDYKRVPDWLNSRFWANPEMWNKTRW